MTRDDVLTALGVLRAAFPHSTVPVETVELYVSRLMSYDLQTLSDVAKEVIDCDDHFPTLHRLVEGCRNRRGHREDQPRFGELPAPLPPVDGVLPEVAQEFRDAITGRVSDTTFQRAWADLAAVAGGCCDECRQDASELRNYGKFLLCAGCCSRRLRYALARGLVAA